MNINTPRLLIITTALIIFSYFYNRAVKWSQDQGHFEGLTALQVVVGVLVTVAAYAIHKQDWQPLLELGILFAGSGSCMILGGLWRWSQANKRFKAEQLALLEPDNDGRG